MAAPGWAKRVVQRHGANVKAAVTKTAGPVTVTQPPAAAPAPVAAAQAAPAGYVSDPRIMPVGTRMWNGQPQAPAQHAPARTQPRGLVVPLPEANQLVRPDPSFDALHASRLASIPDLIVAVDEQGRPYNPSSADAAIADAALMGAAAVRGDYEIRDPKTGAVIGRGSLGGMGPLMSGPGGPRAFPAASAPAAISGAQPLGSGNVPNVDVSK